MERRQNININRCLEEIDSNPHGWLWEVQDFNGGTTGSYDGNSKRTKTWSLKMWLNYCNLMIKLYRWGVASYGWAKKVVFWDGIHSWWKCCEDCWRESKDLEYYINLVDKAVAGFERTDNNSERSSAGKIVSNCTAMLQINHSWKEESIDAANFIVLF